MKKDNDKLTISVNRDIKERYKELCEDLGLKVGKKIELFMQEELNKVGEDNESK